MCTTAMKHQSIVSQISNENFLPFSLNNQVKSLQRKLCWLPLLSSSGYFCGQKSLKIISLKRYKQTKWIHRHHRQTVLSRKSLLLPVGFIFLNYFVCLSILNLWLNSMITFVRSLILIDFFFILSIGM